MGVIDVSVCVYTSALVCKWSWEKSTAGVTLISGVILSSRLQGHVQ